jgi:AcrR family transcriptional regulator
MDRCQSMAKERGRPRSFDRDQALKAAMDVFWAKGYAGASLADLKAAMGINAPSLYAAFGSKEELFEAAVDLYSETAGVELWAHFEDAPDTRTGIAALLLASADIYVAPKQPPGCLVVLGALVGGEAEATVARNLARRRAWSTKKIAERLKAEIAAGTLPKEADPEAIATFYTTLQQGMSLQARDGASRETLRAIARNAMAAWDGLIHPVKISAA